MLYFLISMVVLVGLCDRAIRISRMEFLLYDTRFKLFEIRDRLRRSAIDGEIKTDNWFDYLDTSITKAIDTLPHLTLWQLSILFVHYKDDDTIRHAYDGLMDILREEGNEKLLQTYLAYSTTLTDFLLQRHQTIGITFYLLAKATNKIVTTREKMAKTVSTAPETSTLLKYCEN